jgi:hypothetical protein
MAEELREILVVASYEVAEARDVEGDAGDQERPEKDVTSEGEEEGESPEGAGLPVGARR